MELKFERIFYRTMAEKLAQILSEGGATNIRLDNNNYYSPITFNYKDVDFKSHICYGNVTVRVQPLDGSYHSEIQCQKINTLFQKLDKLVKNGYETEEQWRNRGR